MVPTKNLQAAQLVAGIHNAVGGICAEYIHFLELADHGGAVIGNGGADTRQHGIVMAQLLLAIVKIR